MIAKLANKSISGSIGKVNGIVNTVLTIIIVVIVAVIVYRIYRAAKKGGEIVGDAVGAKIIEAQTGISTQRQSALTTAAENIKSAITVLVFTSVILHIDDDAIVDAVNSCVEPREAVFLSEKVKELTGMSLKNDIVGSWHFHSDSRVKDFVKQNIK